LGFRQFVTEAFLSPWYRSLENPGKAQRDLLRDLLQGYRKTDYGDAHGAGEICGIEEYRSAFPVLDYDSLTPFLSRVKDANFSAILPEPPCNWVMTRGTTGRSKVIPVTRTHIDQIRTCGARAILNFDRRNPEARILAGKVLNLNFPSQVHSMEVAGRTVSYGYSSGTYAKLIPSLNQTSLVPGQEEIDALGAGISDEDWRARFELVFRAAKGEHVTAAMGVAPVISSFGRYLKRAHRRKPRDLWEPVALFCTSVPKIHSKYAPHLREYYGDCRIVEMYTATEGAFGQQLDEFPYISPNYDTYLFEVEMGGYTRMLHQLRRGEWGRLIVSSCLFPRYDIGDMVECLGRNYFRIFGRDTLRVRLEHRLFRLATRWFI